MNPEKPKKPERLIVSDPKKETRKLRHCSRCKRDVAVPCITEGEAKRRKCIPS